MVNMITTKEFTKFFDFNKNGEWQNIKTNSEKPLILDFSADSWCAPCRTLSPILEDLSNEFENKVIFYKIDTDEEYELSKFFNIKSIPTLIFISTDNKLYTHTGSFPKNEIKRFIFKYFDV